MSLALTSEECVELSLMLAAKLEQHIANLAPGVKTAGKAADAGNPLASKPALSPQPDEPCDACDSQRIELDWTDPVIMPCRVCRREAWVAKMAERAEAERCPDTLQNLPTIPAPPPEGCDPWDSRAEEQIEETIRLTSREMCDGESGRGSGCPSLKGDRGGYGEHDDTSDIEAHERTTTYPWGNNG
jgi:hypothetical protein